MEDHLFENAFERILMVGLMTLTMILIIMLS